jgi:hypothetical protein
VPRFAVIIIELKHSAGSFWQFRKPSAHKLWESDLHRLAIPRQGFGISCRLANGAYTLLLTDFALLLACAAVGTCPVSRQGTNMQIISRAEAKAKGLKRYFTGKPCKHGHVAEREVFNATCVECERAAIKKYRLKKSAAGRR